MTGISTVIFIKESNSVISDFGFVIMKHWTKYILLFVCTCTVVNFGI